MRWVEVVQVAVPFLWCGVVLGISFLETPLKFRAPGITLPLGLGIGALVFRALNLVELVLAVGITGAMAAVPPGIGAVALLVVVWVLLLVQVAVVRPRLDRRTREVITGRTPPRSRLHLAYIGLEIVKVVTLPSLGIVLLLEAAA
jgi:hypothetical protein